MDTNTTDIKKAVPTTTEETATAPNQGTETNNKKMNLVCQENYMKTIGYIYACLKKCYERELTPKECLELIREII